MLMEITTNKENPMSQSVTRITESIVRIVDADQYDGGVGATFALIDPDTEVKLFGFGVSASVRPGRNYEVTREFAAPEAEVSSASFRGTVAEVAIHTRLLTLATEWAAERLIVEEARVEARRREAAAFGKAMNELFGLFKSATPGQVVTLGYRGKHAVVGDATSEFGYAPSLCGKDQIMPAPANKRLSVEGARGRVTCPTCRGRLKSVAVAV